MNKIATVVNNMALNKEQARYFFSKAPNYQKLHLWLEPLYEKGFFALDKKAEFEHLSATRFLESVALQNEDNPDQSVTSKLLLISEEIIRRSGKLEDCLSDEMAQCVIRVIFRLHKDNIRPCHIEFMAKHLSQYRSRSLLDFDIQEIVVPMIVESRREDLAISLMDLLFGYSLKDDGSGVSPLLQTYNVQQILDSHSKELARLTGKAGLEKVAFLLEELSERFVFLFGYTWIPTIRLDTNDEKSQNKYRDNYENFLVFFARDLLDELSPDETAPFAKEFLMSEWRHPIFTRLALHAINSKYLDLKDIFWTWMYQREIPRGYELWTLLNEQSGLFEKDEINRVIDWIESFDDFNYEIHKVDRTAENIKKYNSYRRKEYLMCLARVSSKAEALYQEYDQIYTASIDHPGFDHWSDFERVFPYSYANKDDLCRNPLQTLQSFDPSKIEKSNFQTDKDLIYGLGNDLSECVSSDPMNFCKNLEDLENIEIFYKGKIVQGMSNAWIHRKRFDWSKVLDFILQEIEGDFFNILDEEKERFVKEVAWLVESGTQKDDNAFDRKHLPKAKQIIFSLLKNKFPEKSEDVQGELTHHVLNSPNGVVLHALMNYLLRYGRIHSSQKVKWDKEARDFFNNQLKQDTLYSRSFFTILGGYFHNLQFLDNGWAINNFDKIFPIDNDRLWEVSISAYFSYISELYTDPYNLFQDRGHIQKAINFNFEKDSIKSKVISFVCIAHMNNIDDVNMLNIIQSDNEESILEVVNSMYRLYSDDIDSKTRATVKTLWKIILENSALKDNARVFGKLCNWFVFLDKIDDQDLEFLKATVAFAEGGHNSHTLIKEMARLSSKSPRGVGKVFLAMVGNNIYPVFSIDNIKTIIKNLDEDAATYITNAYIKRGVYDLHDSQSGGVNSQ